MTDWNSHFRRIAGSHKMSREEVVECLRLGGMEISRSRADGWRRGLQGGTLERGARAHLPTSCGIVSSPVVSSAIGICGFML